MKHKILIVDDEENIRLALKHTFSDYIVFAVADGEAAVSVIAAEHPDVVLLDLNMPRMNGVEVLAAIKDTADKPQIIMLTGNDELDMAIKALEIGAISYLTKPFDVEGIRNVVMSALGETPQNGKPAGDKPWQVKKIGK